MGVGPLQVHRTPPCGWEGNVLIPNCKSLLRVRSTMQWMYLIPVPCISCPYLSGAYVPLVGTYPIPVYIPVLPSKTFTIRFIIMR